MVAHSWKIYFTLSADAEWLNILDIPIKSNGDCLLKESPEAASILMVPNTHSNFGKYVILSIVKSGNTLGHDILHDNKR